ncbi:MAG: NADH-quinone oxidoreductase subunit L [Actinomycetota bacterium]
MDLIWLVPLLPLAGSVALMLAGKRLRPVAGGLASATVAGSFVVSIVALVDLLGLPAGDRTHVVHLWDWLAAGALNVSVDLRVDTLSVVMALTVTGVGFLIHVYSLDYMHGDPRYTRFFAYLNLFVFFMLTLVLANNFVLMYVGWEGVGLCSYLLISFWFEKKSAADAGKKAFVVTRVGDTGMLIGLILLFSTLGTLDFDRAFELAPAMPEGTATAIALLLFAGAVGKSAQLPLSNWLPDAMEGPTPVSALIHAATMVTAGVYLVVRAHPIFEASQIALFVVAIVGTITALYAATAALGQDDLKRVLAYSTISQLGFMFLAAGVGAYAVAIFHLVAHAFFKALLFLGAGSVMHAMDGDIDVRRLGGLRRDMPITAWTFVIGALALAGLPPLAGFFSKDQILSAAYGGGRVALWVVALGAAAFTAFYIARATLLTFFGEPRHQRTPHESPVLMTAPLMVLAGLTLVGGLLGVSASDGAIARFLGEGFAAAEHHGGGLGEGTLIAIATSISILMLVAGWWVYGSGRVDWTTIRGQLGGLHTAVARGWFLDDLYDRTVVRPGRRAADVLARSVDQGVIDRGITGIGRGFAGLARVGRGVQTGFVRSYALVFLLGVVGILLYVAARFQ